MCAWKDAFTCEARLKGLSAPPEDHQEGGAVGTSWPESRFGFNQRSQAERERLGANDQPGGLDLHSFGRERKRGENINEHKRGVKGAPDDPPLWT